VFARLQFRGREVAFLILLGSLLVPNIVFQVPLYIMMARWPLAGGNDILGQGGKGFVDQLPSLLLPGIVNAYFVFLMRQAFYTIPVEYEEAARLDGASTLRVLWHVYLPLLKPVIAVLVISSFIGTWNEYVWPSMVVASNHRVWPIALGFQRIMSGGYGVPGLNVGDISYLEYRSIPLAAAVATLATLPAVFCFFFFQRYFVEGLQGIGIKG
jgi:multiple sugar transport system permease protein